MRTRYSKETLDPDYDNGTMVSNVETLADAVIGRKIVKVEEHAEIPERVRSWGSDTGFAITLDNGRRVFLVNTDDCCAHTYLEKFLLHPDKVDHRITGVGTTGGYTTWHIHADYGDILQLDVSWTAGNAFYYGYGFNITIVDPEFEPVTDEEMEATLRSIQEGT